MKINAEQVFICELTNLTYAEAKLLEVAVGLVASIEEEDGVEYDITEQDKVLAEKMLPDLKKALRESNWRE